MMTYFFEKAHLSIVWIVWFILVLLLATGMTMFLLPKNDFWLGVKMGIGLGLLFATWVTLIYSSMRYSDKVWVNLKAFNEKVNVTTDPVEFEKLYDELQQLWSESSGSSHYNEIRRLKSVMDMKKQYLK